MQSEAKSGIHPLVATASVAVIVLAGVGVAAFTGVLPGTSGSPAPEAAPAALAPEPKAPEAKKATPKTAEARPVAQPKASAPKPVQVAAVARCLDCGVVESVQEVEVKGEATGAGAVAGGVAGAVIGNQVGSGDKKKVARVIGAVGGAVIGHQVEKSARTTKRYDIAVRMEDGTLQTISQELSPTWRTGDKVRVVNGVLETR